LKKIYAFILIILFNSIKLFSDLNSDIRINADIVEFIENKNQINFLQNVEISSNFVNIKAETAVYDDIREVISIIGEPSTIISNKKDNYFDGNAKEIIFYNDEKVHLIGDAIMKYNNISISSNIIIFNPKTGKISSE
tara:strand:- start:1223 stop:1633 length:411 start_codon:yes stop_codon:yes gene_type:complete